MTKSNASAQAAAVYGSTCEVCRTKGGLGGVADTGIKGQWYPEWYPEKRKARES